MYNMHLIICTGLKYSRDGGDSWTASTGGYPTSGIYWLALASSSTGQFVVAGSFNSYDGNNANSTSLYICICIL